MTWADIDFHPGNRVLRQFAAAWLLVLGGMGAAQWLLRGHSSAGMVLLLVAAVVAIVGWLRPQAVRWPFVASSIAAFPFGWVISQVMLLTLFTALITPVALLFRMTGRDRLWRKRRERQTYWKPKVRTRDVRRYLRQY